MLVISCCTLPYYMISKKKSVPLILSKFDDDSDDRELSEIIYIGHQIYTSLNRRLRLKNGITVSIYVKHACLCLNQHKYVLISSCNLSSPHMAFPLLLLILLMANYFVYFQSALQKNNKKNRGRFLFSDCLTR